MARTLLAVVFFLLASAASAQETRIAAVVNDDVISMADLQARMRLFSLYTKMPDTDDARQRMGSQVLRMLIDEKLELQEARRVKVQVTAEDIQSAFDRLETQNHMAKGQLDEALASRGIDRTSMIDQITAQIAWSRTVQQRGYMVTPISDGDIEDALARLRENAGQQRVRIAEIYLSVDTPQQEDEVHRFADKLYEQLRGGAQFPAVAQQFSQSPTAAVGGDDGWVTPSELPSEVADVVQRLQPNEMAPPVRAAGGYYLVLLIGRQAPGGGSTADTRVSLVQVMLPLPATAPPAEHQKTSERADRISKTAKSCDELKKIGQEEAPQTSGDVGEVRVGDLPPELQPTVLNLKISEASPPVPLRGGIGVLMVCARENAGGLPSREEIAENLSRERFENLERRYIRDLRRAAFVDIRG